jgi:hypothetical protein
MTSTLFWNIYWITAVGLSLFWGYDGVKAEAEEAHAKARRKYLTARKLVKISKIKFDGISVDNKYKKDCAKIALAYNILKVKDIVLELKSTRKCSLKWIGHFISDFLVSFAGWISLLALYNNICTEKFDNFNIFLGTIAFLGIAGYGYKIWERLGVR